MNEWDEYIDAPDAAVECRCCGTQTNGDTVVPIARQRGHSGGWSLDLTSTDAQG